MPTMSHVIDLRSDTVTRPSAGMRTAMFEAEVGDDVFGEDPTVKLLEETVADILGKEAALFVPSGTMANQLAIASQTSPGDEVFLERQSHIFNYESGAPGLLSGVQLHVLDGERGVLNPAQLSASLRHGYYWEPRGRLLCLENTINRVGGRVYPLDRLQTLAETARAHGLSVHLDGARLWNASAASGISEADYAGPFDTVSVCLSKGLGAPIGSLIAGDSSTIVRAHRYRKLFGGGMRQAGILAAAGIYALNHNRGRVRDDHVNAKELAKGLARIPAFAIDPDAVETNMLTFDISDGDAQSVTEAFRNRNVLVQPWGKQKVRLVTHLDVSMDDVRQVVMIAKSIFQ